MRRLQKPRADAYHVTPRESRDAFVAAYAKTLQIVRVTRPHAGHDIPLVAPRPREIAAQRAGDPAAREIAAGSDQARAVIPRLLGNAATVEACAAPLPLLDDRGPQSVQRGQHRGPVTARAGADDDEVELLHPRYTCG